MSRHENAINIEEVGIGDVVYLHSADDGDCVARLVRNGGQCDGLPLAMVIADDDAADPDSTPHVYTDRSEAADAGISL